MLGQLMNKVHASTTSLASTMSGGSSCSDGTSPPPQLPASISEFTASVRRLSIPLGRARVVSRRRFSQIVTTIGEVIDQEILMVNDGALNQKLLRKSVLVTSWRWFSKWFLHLKKPKPKGSVKNVQNVRFQATGRRRYSARRC